ncbi:MAG: bifunctional tetrahydrofolate synthase/dihydrofolate synthase [Pseudomonadota bacterium]
MTDRLPEWLACLEARQPGRIALGLDRVRQVWARLGVAPSFIVITVAGTNGKGSVCAYLEAILVAAGYRVGTYTSPHLLRFNERMRVDGVPAGDEAIAEALAQVEAARAGVELTYFEHTTLAAFWLFQARGIEVAVLEVGLGGRLDAVNLIDADCAVVTQIDIDHVEYLGPDREAIGFEKAGIFRAGRPAICADRSPPTRLLDHAAALGVDLRLNGRDYRVEAGDVDWTCRVGPRVYPALPRPALLGHHQLDNAAAALVALDALRTRLPVPLAALRAGLRQATQPGRFQIIGQAPLRILDVAHNPHAARALAGALADLPPTGRRMAVFGLLADKDAEGVLDALAGRIDHWHVAGLSGPRGRSAADLAGRLDRRGWPHTQAATVTEAWRAACQAASPADTIIAFGSFHTVAEILADLQDARDG